MARTGDQLQGMKRGILEIVDVIAVNKADGPHVAESARAAREFSSALRLLRGTEGAWQTPVVTCSALTNAGLDKVWKHVIRHRDQLAADSGLERKRRRQLVEWTRAMVRDRLLARLDTPGVREVAATTETAVLSGQMTPDQAAQRILGALDGRTSGQGSASGRDR
jgi:LAO/AO transport system kinase